MGMSAPLMKKADAATGLSRSGEVIASRNRIDVRRHSRPGLFTSSGRLRVLFALVLTGAIWGLVLSVVSG